MKTKTYGQLTLVANVHICTVWLKNDEAHIDGSAVEKVVMHPTVF